METRVETLSPVTRKLIIDLKPEDVNEEYNSIVKELKKIAKIPGFRKNKAPVHLIEARYKKEIEQEILRFIVNDKYPKAVEKNRQKLGKIIREEVVNFKLDPDRSVSSEFYVEVLPEIELKELDSPTLEIPKQERGDLEETTTRVLEDLRQQRSQLKPVKKEKAEKGDFVEIKLEGKDKNAKTLINNEKLELELQDTGYWGPIIPNLIGMAPEEEKDFTVTYPDSKEFGMLAGETVSFSAKLNQILEKSIPELNDDFAKEIGKFDTLDALKEDIRKNLTEKYDQAEKSAKQRAVMDYLLKIHNFEAPPYLIHGEARKITENYFSQLAQYGIPMEQDEEKIKEIYDRSRPEAEQRVKESLILSRFAEQFKIEVEESEINEFLEKAAANFGENATVAQVRKAFEEQGEMDAIRNMIRNEKTFDLLVEKVTFTEKEMDDNGDSHGETVSEEEETPTAAVASDTTNKTEEEDADSDGN